jgi:hypothetical protein
MNIYAFSRTLLEQMEAGQTPTESMTTLATGVTVSGSGTIVADNHGNIYILGADAIYKVDSAGHESVFAGDPSINVWDSSSAGIGFTGLTNDAATDQLLYAYRASTTDSWQYQAAPAPEPATLALLAAGAGLAWVRRRKS